MQIAEEKAVHCARAKKEPSAPAANHKMQ